MQPTIQLADSGAPVLHLEHSLRFQIRNAQAYGVKELLNADAQGIGDSLRPVWRGTALAGENAGEAGLADSSLSGEGSLVDPLWQTKHCYLRHGFIVGWLPAFGKTEDRNVRQRAPSCFLGHLPVVPYVNEASPCANGRFGGATLWRSQCLRRHNKSHDKLLLIPTNDIALLIAERDRLNILRGWPRRGGRRPRLLAIIRSGRNGHQLRHLTDDAIAALPGCGRGFRPYGIADVWRVAGLGRSRRWHYSAEPTRIRQSGLSSEIAASSCESALASPSIGMFLSREKESRSQCGAALMKLLVNDDRDVTFGLPGGEWHLSFSKTCIQLLEKHSQRHWHQREWVGQLFTADLTGARVRIDTATVLRPKMFSRTTVAINVAETMSQRHDFLAKGPCCIGLWHTHPTNTCEPSGPDECLAADHALAARSVLNGLGFVIVGKRPFPLGWYIGVHDGVGFHRAYPVDDLIPVAVPKHSL